VSYSEDSLHQPLTQPSPSERGNPRPFSLDLFHPFPSPSPSGAGSSLITPTPTLPLSKTILNCFAFDRVHPGRGVSPSHTTPAPSPSGARSSLITQPPPYLSVKQYLIVLHSTESIQGGEYPRVTPPLPLPHPGQGARLSPNPHLTSQQNNT